MTTARVASGGEPVSAPWPAILVVAIDRLPAWMLPAYGSTWVAMPALDGLAARGVVLDRLVAATDDPGRTLADILGGVVEGGTAVAAAASARGWSTALVTDDAAAAGAAARGVDVVEVAVARPPAVADSAEATSLGRLFAAAAEVVAARRHAVVVVHASSLGATWDAPDDYRLAYVDPDDPHPAGGAAVPDFAVPVDADPDLLVGVRQAFAGQLTLLDRCLERLLAAAGGGRHVMLVGLRGIGLGLHGHVGGEPLPPYGELVHLPAMLAAADGGMAGQRFGGLALPADVGATLLEWLGRAPPRAGEPWGGASLAGLFTAWSVTGRDRVIVSAAGGTAMTTPAWHLVRKAGAVEPARLFVKPDDFFELSDVADRRPDTAEELGRLLDAAAAGRLEEAWSAPLSRGSLEAPG